MINVSFIDYFKNKLNTNFIDKFDLQYSRGLDSQIVTKDVITKRVRNNIKCPFFQTDIEDYKRFVKITNKLSLDNPEVMMNANFFFNPLTNNMSKKPKSLPSYYFGGTNLGGTNLGDTKRRRIHKRKTRKNRK